MAAEQVLVAERTRDSLLTHVLDYESSAVHVDAAMDWLNQHWTDSVWISGMYVALVFGGIRFMKERPALKLRALLGIWSSLLAAYSILGTLRTVPELYHSVTGHSFENSVCNPSFLYEAPSAFWAFTFPFSKVLELGDTAFLVLRKRPVIFLHWYHHVTVMIYCFFTYGQVIALGRYFMTLNFVVHSVMYSYYALKSFDVWIPRWVSMLITSMQLSQMVVGVFINVKAYFYLNQGHQCATSYTIIFWAFLMYASYLVLFAHFFYSAYLKPRPSKSKGHHGQQNGTKAGDHAHSEKEKKVL